MGKQLIYAFVSTAAFSILYHIPKRHLLLASLGGLLSWGCYLLLGNVTENLFYRVLLVSILAAAYAEVMAKLRRAPATLYLIPALIPLVPGSYVYYAMLSLVQHDLSGALQNMLLAGQWAVAISMGISLSGAAEQLLRRRAPHRS